MSTLPPCLQRLVGSFLPWTERDYFIQAFPSQEHAVVRYTARNKSELPENALLKHVILPEGLQQVGASAFDECSITSVTLPLGCSYVDQTDEHPSFPLGCTISFRSSSAKRRRLSLKPALQQLRF